MSVSSGREVAGTGADHPVNEAGQVWSQCVGALRSEVPDSVWRTWLAPMQPLRLEGRQLIFGVPAPLFKERIDSRYRSHITDVLSDVTGETYELVLEVHAVPGLDYEAVAEEPLPLDLVTGPSTTHRETASARSERDIELNPAYTFERFIVGDSNNLAHAAALSVGETPGKSYNPLFIHGPTGLGKTHLLHAIGHLVHETCPGLLVRYVSTEMFLSDFIDAIRTNSMPSFRSRYRQCGVLLVDDVQLIEGKERFQHEFFHTFDFLRVSGRQVVVTCDRPPKALATLEERLVSRFAQGLTVDVEPAELETRVAILHKKAESELVPVPGDVLDYIASSIKDNIRQLEGALNRVIAYASLYRRPLSVELAEAVLADLITSGRPKPITSQAVLEATSEMFGFPVDELIGKSRSRPLVTARQIAMYVLRQTTSFSYPAIGKIFGNRDHTTVMHAVTKIEGQMRDRKGIYDQVNELLSRLKNSGNRGVNA